MDFFTIGDIENLTQIKAHTFRTWEQRYGLCLGKRKNSMHRYYDGEDLKQILRVALLYHQGLKISHIATLSSEEIKNKALGLSVSDGSFEGYQSRLMESSIDLDMPAFEEILNQALAAFGFTKTMIEICFPFLNRLGLLWLSGHVVPAQEHLVSAIILQKIYLEIDQLPQVLPLDKDRRVLLFSPVGEYHEIPLLFMKFLLKKNGVKHTYMGPATEIETLTSYARGHPVTELYFHLITNLTHGNFNDYLQELSLSFPHQKIYCSGYACSGLVNTPGNVQILMSYEELINFTR